MEERKWAFRRALRGTVAVAVPFLLAAWLGLRERVVGVNLATAEITELALEIERDCLPSLTVSECVQRAQKNVFGDLGTQDGRKAEDYLSLVRVAAREVYGPGLRRTDVAEAFWGALTALQRALSGGDVCAQAKATARQNQGPGEKAWHLCRETRGALLLYAYPMILGQALLLLIFPILFSINLWRSHAGLKRARLSTEGWFPSLAAAVHHRRFRFHLEQEESLVLFLRRLAYALLVGYGVAYLVGPLGQKSMAIGDFTALNAIPGDPTYPYLFRIFEQTPLFSVGFAGFYLYALAASAHRLASGDLSERFVFTLFRRLITVLLLTLFVVPALGEPGAFTRALVFAVGIFPQAGVQAVEKLTKTAISRYHDEATLRFRAIPEVDFWMESSLQELGIDEVSKLAKHPVDHLLEQLGANPAVLLRAVDRAVLVDTLGLDAVQPLAAFPLFTASEVVLYVRGWGALQNGAAGRALLTEDEQAARRARLEEALGKTDLSIRLETLESSANVQRILQLRARYGEA